MPTFRKTFLAACLVAARCQNANRFRKYGDFREEVWVNPKFLSVTQRREYDDDLFIGEVSDFLNFETFDEIENVLNERLFERSESENVGDALGEVELPRSNLIDALIRARRFLNENPLVVFDADYTTLQVATRPTPDCPVFVASLRQTVWSYNASEGRSPEDYRRLYLWLAIEHLIQCRKNFEEIARQLIRIAKTDKEKRNVYNVSLNQSLSSVALWERSPVEYYPIHVGSLRSLWVKSKEFGVASRVTEIGNELTWRLNSYGEFN
jgi:hypothetical protein